MLSFCDNEAINDDKIDGWVLHSPNKVLYTRVHYDTAFHSIALCTGALWYSVPLNVFVAVLHIHADSLLKNDHDMNVYESITFEKMFFSFKKNCMEKVICVANQGYP